MEKRQKNPTIDGRKICPACGKEKDLSEFTAGKPNYCKKCRSLKTQEYYRKNKEVVLEKKKTSNKTYRQSEAGKQSQYRYQSKKYKNNIHYKLSISLGTRLWHALKEQSGALKSKRTFELAGCSIEDLKLHLESQFQEGMSWENYGKKGWEIDHIKPVTKFDLSDPEQQKVCFHYTNLQPLWGEENRKKSNKYVENN